MKKQSERNRKILELHEMGMTVRRLAEIYNVHPSRIGYIIQRERKSQKQTEQPRYIVRTKNKKL